MKINLPRFNHFLIKLLLVLILSLLSSCSQRQSYTTLEIHIIQHPVGGQYRTLLSATVQGKLIFNKAKKILSANDEPEGIQVFVEWWWKNFEGLEYTLIATDLFNFTVDTLQTHTTSITIAPNQNFFAGYYWVKLKWNDHDRNNTAQELESALAYCIDPSSED